MGVTARIVRMRIQCHKAFGAEKMRKGEKAKRLVQGTREYLLHFLL